MVSRVIAIVACLLAGGAIAFAVTSNASSAAQVRTLHQELSQLQAKEAGDSNRAMAAVGALTPPTDPLTAYNQICDQDFTNNDTGITQTYWFPCTNQAQTIPQPGT